MVSFVIGAAGFATVLALLCWCCAAGFRNGDLATDAEVSAVLGQSGQPDESRPVVVATVRNPSRTPVLAGLSARRARIPGWLCGGLDVTVPRLTRRRAFRPSAYETVGVVPGETAVRFVVPVPAPARRYLLTAVTGQPGGRLRVYRLHLAPVHDAPVPLGRISPIGPNGRG
jgi:hypothetical protein